MAATFPAFFFPPAGAETQPREVTTVLLMKRAATFTSAHHISFSLLSGTIVRRVKGESFDVAKMKNRFRCRGWTDK